MGVGPSGAFLRFSHGWFLGLELDHSATGILRRSAAGFEVPRFVGSLFCYQEWITLALITDCSEGAMARNHDRVVRKFQNFVVQGTDDLLKRAAGKIGTANASGEERVSRNEFLFGRE